MTKVLLQCLAVGVGGFAGALARYGVAAVVNAVLPTRFPLATLLINVSGSFALGWLTAAARDRGTIPPALWLALATGFLGAYTTFSTFTAETVRLGEDGWLGHAAANVAASLLLGLAACWAGLYVGRR